ncbi:dual specificity protein phosphatase family protein [Oscillatoriales cyanobacterium LEGE 11467]|uniref:Dual specificity protein phosphatase family protein n=1 Tax=Zarconia navalis LEGE 11467 TaxID=1828826 RepID=A0A928W297_9CYAN|nr:dual specificity protein phosphatase family protein [Zarconia navalis]MBE9042613.1 dual specificity protein phosphatase family protein [Zarconia navalis LEGE 11467]
MYKFAAASEDEPIVFGSARPGYRNEQVAEWIEFMQNRNIKYVCCLLATSELTRYANLLDLYRQTFGFDRVCWTPIEDFCFATPEILIQQVLPFLATARQQDRKVVVHCSGGFGRTGQVLAAWLVAGRGFSSQAAIAAVKQIGKNPYEAVIAAPFKGRNPWKIAAEFNLLLDECSRLKDKLA